MSALAFPGPPSRGTTSTMLEAMHLPPVAIKEMQASSVASCNLSNSSWTNSPCPLSPTGPLSPFSPLSPSTSTRTNSSPLSPSTDSGSSNSTSTNSSPPGQHDLQSTSTTDPDNMQSINAAYRTQYQHSCSMHRVQFHQQFKEASALYKAGQHSQAEKLFRQLLLFQNRAIGPEHPSTLITLEHLGQTLCEQGRHSEAETMLRELLLVRQRVLPDKDDALILKSVHLLGNCLVSQGKGAEAEHMLQRCLELNIKRLGHGHALVVQDQITLGRCLGSIGKHDEALPLLQSALKHSQNLHSTALKHFLPIAMWDTARCLRRLGRCQEAEPVLRELVKRARCGLAGHEFECMVEHAECLLQMDRHAQAAVVFSLAVEVCHNMHGSSVALAHMKRFISLLGRGGAWKQAEALAKNMVTRLAQAAGPAHTLTLQWMGVLADTCEQQGRKGKLRAGALRCHALQLASSKQQPGCKTQPQAAARPGLNCKG